MLSGAFNHVCEFCGALKFEKEDEFKCCSKGKVSLPQLEPFPPQLQHLFTDDSNEAKEFRKKLRIYNNTFAFGSFSANLRPPPGIGPPTFRICGQICHRYGTHFPNEEQPQCAQLYIIEAAQALDLRMQNPSAVDCNRATMALIQDVLETVNHYAASFKHMKQVEQEQKTRAIAENRPVSRITMVMREGHDQRRGNVPLHEEVAAIFTGEDGAPPAGRNIVVYPRNHHLQSIPSTSSVVDPYIYPLLFQEVIWAGI
ncbi:uncharacterized protein [Clytia hemisphaerica]|uniref:uncharacterized protein n=1 Tax=Clytia hemisphaerica TaxID=252671 RepID=UPI0034D3992C